MRTHHVLRGVAVALAVLAGCSLGIDRSLVQPPPAGDDGSPPVGAGTDAPPKEAGGDHAAPVEGAPPPPSTGCTTDADCAPGGDAGSSCVSAGTCDTTWHVCILTTCDAGAGKSSGCGGAAG